MKLQKFQKLQNSQKLQKINSGKLNEMTSEKYYNAKKINEL